MHTLTLPSIPAPGKRAWVAEILAESMTTTVVPGPGAAVLP